MSAPRRSIRRDLLGRLLATVLLITMLAGASAHGLARYFSQSVLDQWLYDSAISLANTLRWGDGRAYVDLPEGARRILEWDIVDRLYYEVVSRRTGRLIWNARLPDPPSRASASPVYYDGRVRQAPVRVVAMAVKLPGDDRIVVKVAETRLKRRALVWHMLWISVALSLALAALSGAGMWYAVGRGMKSVESVVRRVGATHAAAPLSPITADGTVPEEVQPLLNDINSLIENLNSAHELNERFISNAAHQLRTPLATLRVQLDLAQREADPAHHRDAMNEAIEVLARMGRTVNQLLTLAKADGVEESGLGIGSAVDLAAVARQEVERRIDDASRMDVDLGYEGPHGPVKITGIEDLVREAIANLLDNALRYGGRGSRVTVGVDAREPEVYVEDDGPGIPASERPRVSERFYRLRGAAAGGAGLGLSIVNEIAKRHAAALVLQDGACGRGLRARLVFSTGRTPS